jgi:hypothetical protein
MRSGEDLRWGWSLSPQALPSASARRPRAPSSRRRPHCLIRAAPLLRVEAAAAAAGGRRDAPLLRIEGAAAVRIRFPRIELSPSAAGVHAPPWPSPPSSRSTELGCTTPPRDPPPPPPRLPRSSARWWSRPLRASPPRRGHHRRPRGRGHGLTVASDAGERERADRVGGAAVGLQRREIIPGMHDRGEATANCSSRRSMHSRASFRAYGGCGSRRRRSNEGKPKLIPEEASISERLCERDTRWNRARGSFRCYRRGQKSSSQWLRIKSVQGFCPPPPGPSILVKHHYNAPNLPIYTSDSVVSFNNLTPMRTYHADVLLLVRTRTYTSGHI